MPEMYLAKSHKPLPCQGLPLSFHLSFLLSSKSQLNFGVRDVPRFAAFSALTDIHRYFLAENDRYESAIFTILGCGR